MLMHLKATYKPAYADYILIWMKIMLASAIPFSSKYFSQIRAQNVAMQGILTVL